MRTLLFFLLATLPPSLMRAQQFPDYWLGDWDVFSVQSGRLIGENHLTKMLDGKVVFEHWTDVLGIEGHSFTLYDSVSGCWLQNWVDNRGIMNNSKGRLSGDTMMFLSGSVPEGNSKALHRMSLIPVSPNELIQCGEVSIDSAQHWQKKFHFRYLRKPANDVLNCRNAPRSLAYFRGEIEYAYSYESEQIDADSLARTKPGKSIFRYDLSNYRSCFMGPDTVTYYYDGERNRCLAQSGQQPLFECEDYGVLTDSVGSWRLLDSDEKILGHRVSILEIQSKYFFTRYYISQDAKISPATWDKHLAYNWAFYGDKTDGGLILKLEHRFKQYTMRGIATRITKAGEGFDALGLPEGSFEQWCK
ncbi:MAG: hypothetical protein H6565_03675 [Lewinellaceae bacterium]|nr:hypothetical protein [Lewinellaceae bacterium]